jgi:enoyl-CoA hydratase/carnithine racemase
MDKKVLYKKEGHVFTIIINRPEKLNCIDAETEDLLVNAWSEFKNDEDAFVAIITGAGEKAFCTGADLSGYLPKVAGTATYLRRRAYDGPGFGGYTRGIDIFKPIIAAINGLCFAGGMEIAAAADIRICAEDARFGCLERRWNVGLGDGGTQRMPRIMGMGNALYYIITGKDFDAEEAMRTGFINEIVKKGNLMERAKELAEMISEFPQGAIRVDKEALIRGVGTPLTEGLRIESMLFNTLLNTHDFYEGPKAFVEKRKPKFDNE